MWKRCGTFVLTADLTARRRPWLPHFAQSSSTAARGESTGHERVQGVSGSRGHSASREASLLPCGPRMRREKGASSPPVPDGPSRLMRSVCRASRLLLPLALGVSTLSCSECPGGAPQTYVLDLSVFEGGLDAPGSSVAFPIDTSSPVKHVTERSPSQILTINSRVGCWSGAEDNLESAALRSGIPEGDGACVHSIEIVFDADGAGSACYGYRSLDGEWHYDLTYVQPESDASGTTRAARIPVTGGPMDAIDLPFATGSAAGILEIRFDAVPEEP